MAHIESTGKIPFKEKIAYGFGDLASVLYWQTFMLYFTFFYTDVFLLPASIAATLFLVSRIFDGVNDTIMGIIADRTDTRWGKFRPFILWFAIPFAVVGVFTFTVPDLELTGKIIWAYVTFNLIMILYTVINIPYTALLGVISPSSTERTSVSSIKFIFAFAAGIIVSASLLPLTEMLGDEGNAAVGWQRAFIVYGIAAVAFFMITFLGTKERVKPMQKEKTPIKTDIKELVTNKPWLILLLTTITFILFVAVRGSVTVHYFKYIIGEQTLSLPFFSKQSYDFNVLASAYNTVGQISSLIGVLAISFLAKKFGKQRMFITFFILAIVGTALVKFLSSEQLGLLFILQIISSFTGGPLSVLLWAMYADTADYAEYKNGRRSTGLIFSASTMSQKIGWAFGAFIALQLMAQVGFQPNEAQSADSVAGLINLFTIIPAGVGIISIIIFLKYPLKDAEVAAIEKELTQRRELHKE